ncbi:hypothetical protein OUZ56_032392 [Daphnia magna]|uniref:Uncharacterized protein n=1 Tax=Daphnia magna TaxID=35525 RepID=A0ABR0B8T1_9CRUS|nr:hypothetical protein OUZ56_032392 [Daphnia magna]
MPGESANEMDGVLRLSAGNDPLGAALRAAKREAPPAGLEGRVAARLGVPLVAGGIAASVPTAKVAVAATKGMAGVALKLAALAVVGVGLGVGGSAGRAGAGDGFRFSPVGAAARRRCTDGGGESGGAGPASPALGACCGPVDVPAAAGPSVDTLAAEAALLTEARNALATGDLGAARAALARHRASFPAGALVLERNVLELEVRAKSGDSGAAREAARLAADPRYRPYQQRLRTLAAPVPAP